MRYVLILLFAISMSYSKEMCPSNFSTNDLRNMEKAGKSCFIQNNSERDQCFNEFEYKKFVKKINIPISARVVYFNGIAFLNVVEDGVYDEDAHIIIGDNKVSNYCVDKEGVKKVLFIDK